MDYADCIMCVSELTRRTVIEQYHQNPKKVFAMHNASILSRRNTRTFHVPTIPKRRL